MKLGLLSLFGLFSVFTFASCEVKKSADMEADVNVEGKIEEVDKMEESKLDTATFGAGCFWCVEAVFQQLKGVKSVRSGYSGGEIINPSYKEICTGRTGHAEVIQITYDKDTVSFDDLLEVFWQTHDPTTLNKQGADEGTQYRSVVFYHNDFQKGRAEFYKEKFNKENTFDAPVVTEISPIKNFFVAEDYHQNYFNENGEQPYCRMVIQPKVEKFQKAFKDKLK